MSEEHFPGCHPEVTDELHEMPAGYRPRDIEDCWHCRMPTPRGCGCADCLDAADVVPPAVVYHCPVCRRWWSYTWPWMTTTTITFDPDEN